MNKGEHCKVVTADTVFIMTQAIWSLDIIYFMWSTTGDTVKNTL